MEYFDVCSGDADDLFALHQLRLATAGQTEGLAGLDGKRQRIDRRHFAEAAATRMGFDDGSGHGGLARRAVEVMVLAWWPPPACVD